MTSNSDHLFSHIRVLEEKQQKLNAELSFEQSKVSQLKATIDKANQKKEMFEKMYQEVNLEKEQFKVV